MKEKIILMLSLLIIVICSVTIGYLAQDKIESLIRDIRQEDIETPKQCENLTMKETAYCLNDYVRGIFKYKERRDYENPSLEELKEEGGDCLNWAELYMGHIEKLGFSAKRPLIDFGEKYLHTFTIISDETGYCILDQKRIECFELKGSVED